LNIFHNICIFRLLKFVLEQHNWFKTLQMFKNSIYGSLFTKCLSNLLMFFYRICNWLFQRSQNPQNPNSKWFQFYKCFGLSKRVVYSFNRKTRRILWLMFWNYNYHWVPYILLDLYKCFWNPIHFVTFTSYICFWAFHMILNLQLRSWSALSWTFIRINFQLWTLNQFTDDKPFNW
jgi:hypothetical protein